MLTKLHSAKINWLIITAMFLFLTIGTNTTVSAQSKFKKGDRVEADVNMSSSPENARWEKAVIVEIMEWNGKISGIFVRTDSGGEYTLGERNLRSLSDGGKKTTADPNPPTPETKTVPPKNTRETQTANGEFNSGDRVEVDSIMAAERVDSKWKKATVKAFDPQNKRYVVMLDDFNEMSVLIRPGKIWIRPLNDGSSTPVFDTCVFFKDYQKVSNSAAPSAELFKSVIFDWFNSINKYSDFGLEFVDFKMGRTFKNRALGSGRKEVDTAPIGATIYSLKTKIVKCEKDLNSTFRTQWTNEYSCYKNEFGEWTCKNAAPQNYKRTSFPNEH